MTAVQAALEVCSRQTGQVPLDVGGIGAVETAGEAEFSPHHAFPSRGAVSTCSGEITITVSSMG